MLGHIGTWMAEAGMVLEQIRFGTYHAVEIDVDAFNARFLDAMRDVPLAVVRAQSAASRARMLRHWAALPERTPEAERWVRKSGPEHYDEHLPRLREWVAEIDQGDRASSGSERNCRRRNSWALAATTMVEALMATAPTAMVRSMPQGVRTPAATGMAMTL